MFDELIKKHLASMLATPGGIVAPDTPPVILLFLTALMNISFVAWHCALVERQIPLDFWW